MKSLALLVFVAACGDIDKPSLDGPYECGPNVCESGQVCIVETSGSQCRVDYDAGIGQYQEISWACVDLPTECDGVPSCDCVTTVGSCFGISDDGRRINGGCI